MTKNGYSIYYFTEFLLHKQSMEKLFQEKIMNQYLSQELVLKMKILVQLQMKMVIIQLI
jgi:hypothetical protein